MLPKINVSFLVTNTKIQLMSLKCSLSSPSSYPHYSSIWPKLNLSPHSHTLHEWYFRHGSSQSRFSTSDPDSFPTAGSIQEWNFFFSLPKVEKHLFKWPLLCVKRCCSLGKDGNLCCLRNALQIFCWGDGKTKQNKLLSKWKLRCEKVRHESPENYAECKKPIPKAPKL